MALFEFTGTDPSDPTHYILASSTSCPGSPQRMCTLEAANNGSDEPVITDALKDEMINSLQNEVNGTNVTLKERV